MRRLLASFSLGLVLGPVASAPALAQGLPAYVPVNPVLTSRNAVYFQPFLDGAPKWQFRLITDYANMVELSERTDGRLLIDAEILRLDWGVYRNLGRGFVGVSGAFTGAYDGFLDGFLDWYHDLTGLKVAAREVLPKNEFDYSLTLPQVGAVTRRPSSLFFNDLRVVGGHRHTRHWQTTASITLPTGSGPAGYDRGVASFNAVTTVRAPIDHRWTYEGSFGLGYTPRHGDLSLYQLTFFQSASSGFRYRFWGRQAMFINAFYQSAGYQTTGLRSLDQRELTLDYGFLLKARNGPEWFLGMSEDLEPRGPAIDLSFRIGARW
jgi:hypothetical protein